MVHLLFKESRNETASITSLHRMGKIVKCIRIHENRQDAIRFNVVEEKTIVRW